MERAQDVLTRILRGGSIEDKLAGAGTAFAGLDWSCSGQETGIPSLPGREGLRGLLSAESSPGLPKPSELRHSLTARGRFLHFFANHELLAIETMALALLRFPDAPEAFRQGLFRTLQDEQKHLRSYLARMEDYGVEFGSVPLSFYFWNALKKVTSPLEFVAGMGLTFEQANLDFALETARFFTHELGDPVTGLLLQEVHDDEVRHVAHGWKWFQEWKKPTGRDDFEAYQEALPFPLTPRRARGSKSFSFASRAAAGLPDAFSRSIRIAGGSRGRLPDLHVFNPGCELEFRGETFSPAVKKKIADFEPLLAWVAVEEDLILSASRPPLPFLEEVHRLRGELPMWVAEVPGVDRLPEIGSLRPWGHSPASFRIAEGLSGRIRNPVRFGPSRFPEGWYDKAYWKRELRTEGFSISSPDELERIRSLTEAKNGAFLVKEGAGASGRGHLLVGAGGLAGEELLPKLKGKLARSGSLVIEPFYEKICDFSVQMEVEDNGEVRFGEPRIFFTDPHFSYRGAMLGTGWGIWKDRLERIRTERERLHSEYRKIAAILVDGGYSGPFGVDGLLVMSPEGQEKVVPVIEVNVRQTMGRVALRLEEFLLKGVRGKSGAALWVFLNSSDLLSHGAGTFVELERMLVERYGARFVQTTPASEAHSTWTFAILEAGDGTELIRTFIERDQSPA